MKKNGRSKKGSTGSRVRKEAGQALPMVLILGVVLGVFALTMVFLLIQETKHGVMTSDQIGRASCRERV